MITFDKATPADAPALTDVQTRCFDDDSRRFAGQERGGPPGYDSVAWQIEMMRRATAYYAIKEDGRIIGGIILFHVQGDHYELGRIYLDLEAQHRGIGAQAMAFIEDAFPQAARWTLGTPSWAVRNHYFYTKCGYSKVGEVAEEGGMIEFRYEKKLAR